MPNQLNRGKIMAIKTVIVSDRAMQILQDVMRLSVMGERTEKGDWLCKMDEGVYDGFMELAPAHITDISEFLIGVMALFEAEGFGPKWREMVEASQLKGRKLQ